MPTLVVPACSNSLDALERSIVCVTSRRLSRTDTSAVGNRPTQQPVRGLISWLRLA